jgi:hypothetical protein
MTLRIFLEMKAVPDTLENFGQMNLVLRDVDQNADGTYNDVYSTNDSGHSGLPNWSSLRAPSFVLLPEPARR